MVMPLWQPQYLNTAYPVRVKDPHGVLGTDRAVVAVRKEVWDHRPAQARATLSRIRLGIPEITELERQIVFEGKPGRVAARERCGPILDERKWPGQAPLMRRCAKIDLACHWNLGYEVSHRPAGHQSANTLCLTEARGHPPSAKPGT